MKKIFVIVIILCLSNLMCPVTMANKGEFNTSDLFTDSTWKSKKRIYLTIADSGKTVKEILSFYNSKIAQEHNNYVVAKQRVAVLFFLDSLKVADSIKVKLFRLVTYEEPKPDVNAMSESEFQDYLKSERLKKNEYVNKYRNRRQEALRILGETKGADIWHECIKIMASFNEELFKHTGGVPQIKPSEE